MIAAMVVLAGMLGWGGVVRKVQVTVWEVA